MYSPISNVWPLKNTYSTKSELETFCFKRDTKKRGRTRKRNDRPNLWPQRRGYAPLLIWFNRLERLCEVVHATTRIIRLFFDGRANSIVVSGRYWATNPVLGYTYYVNTMWIKKKTLINTMWVLWESQEIAFCLFLKDFYKKHHISKNSF